ncbi:DUF421 domain-containing protein [Paenibacillus sp. PR3]|uniref:DUF421 domain-containing protein n=1 Tax=Paenibacillus terricola TaxID=2763503 RepID=A0ABR8MU60_9BACL|nr:YetF domain-containing protein [Paenibacillus terricola]MBD3919165.1 DUF421 domain-containing protein [Paenibacillus terricola]
MWTIFWSTILLACVGTLFLRMSGRKSISQMTIPQVMILLALGTVLGSEVSGKGMTKTVLALATFIVFLIAVEWITLRSNRMESILKGTSVSVIHEGQLQVDNLRKLRMSVDDLEKRLRLAGISHCEDVKIGTIENNGEFGYELYPEAKPVTVKDMERMLMAYFPQLHVERTSGAESIFSEVQNGFHRDKVPTKLQ